jgi:hypothetical protein
MYRRARDLAVGAMRYRDDGIDAALAAKPDVLKRYLQEHYTDAEDDVAPVFWAASAWGSILNTERGRQYFEQALKLTQRKAHIVLVNYARLYALTLNDKPLFLKLLREVIEAGDQGTHYRLSNKIARVRAEMLLAKADQLL